MTSSFSTDERDVLARMGADFSALPDGATSPEVSAEDLTRAAAELDALVEAMPQLGEVVGAAGGTAYGVLHWLRRPNGNLVDENDGRVSPLEWIEQGRPIEDVARLATDLHTA